MDTTTHTTYTDAANHVPATAHPLDTLTRYADADIHQIWLDDTTGTVYHAYTEDNDHWTLDTETAAEATGWVTETATVAYLADAGGEADQLDTDAMDEVEEVRLAAVRADAAQRHGVLDADHLLDADDELTVPVITDRLLRDKMTAAQDELAALGRMRARHIAAAWNIDERGGAARAARDLGISRPTVGRILKGRDRTEASE